MAFCRFNSSAENLSQLYVFQDGSGAFVTMTASYNPDGSKIKLPDSGSKFVDGSIDDLIDRVKRLVGLGYAAPSWLIFELENERDHGPADE